MYNNPIVLKDNTYNSSTHTLSYPTTTRTTRTTRTHMTSSLASLTPVVVLKFSLSHLPRRQQKLVNKWADCLTVKHHHLLSLSLSLSLTLKFLSLFPLFFIFSPRSSSLFNSLSFSALLFPLFFLHSPLSLFPIPPVVSLSLSPLSLPHSFTSFTSYSFFHLSLFLRLILLYFSQHSSSHQLVKGEIFVDSLSGHQ